MKVTDWRNCKLGDLLHIKHGFAFLGEHFASSGTHVVLTPGNFLEEGGFKEKVEKAKWYVGSIPDDYVLNKGDLIVAMTEQAEGLLGSSALIPRGGIYLHNQRLGLVQIRDQTQADQHFIYYLFNSKPVRQQIRGSASGTKIRHTAPSRISEVKVSVPKLQSQQRIAGILSAYDELIENSQRRIKILEAMARGLYREWFVHFRFPGHKNHPRVASALGEIPQGWEVKKLGDISCCINRGITPIYDEEGDSFVINQKCVRDQRLTLEPARKQSKAVSNEKRVCFGDVLVNSTGVGTLGRVAQVYENLENYTVDTHVTIARAKRDIDLDFYGCCLLSLQETFERMGVGATGQTELGRAAISDIDLAIPPIILQQQFGKSVHGIRSAAETYAKKIQNLRRTRDLLLPRLLSGQIEVKVA